MVYLLDLRKRKFWDVCGFDPEPEMPAAYSSAYVGYFLYSWIEVWFRRRMRNTAEEMIA